MRNVLAHRYFALDSAIIWRTITDDLPKLKRVLQDVLASITGHKADDSA